MDSGIINAVSERFKRFWGYHSTSKQVFLKRFYAYSNVFRGFRSGSEDFESISKSFYGVPGMPRVFKGMSRDVLGYLREVSRSHMGVYGACQWCQGRFRRFQ